MVGGGGGGGGERIRQPEEMRRGDMKGERNKGRIIATVKRV